MAAICSVVHEVLTKCTVCVRLTAKPPRPLMANLPATRVQQFCPFIRIGMDYAGPLQMRELKLRKSRSYKLYIAVFVCFAIKAVHLEVLSELSPTHSWQLSTVSSAVVGSHVKFTRTVEWTLFFVLVGGFRGTVFLFLLFLFLFSCIDLFNYFIIY